MGLFKRKENYSRGESEFLFRREGKTVLKELLTWNVSVHFNLSFKFMSKHALYMSALTVSNIGEDLAFNTIAGANLRRNKKNNNKKTGDIWWQ